MDCLTIPEIGCEAFLKRLRARVPDRRLPTSGSLEITFRCNLRCRHCYLGRRRFEPPRHLGVPEFDELTTVELKHIIDQVVSAGSLWFLITGGEPLLRPDLLEILHYARRKGLLVILFTNGTLLTEKFVQKLAECPPVYLEITLYGRTRETYESVTGVRGSFSRCMRGIRRLKQYQVPFKLKTTTLTLNVHELDAMQAFADELGVPFRQDAMLDATLDGSLDPYQYRLSPLEVVRIEKKEHERKNIHLDPQGTANYHPAQPMLLYQCGAGKREYHIDPFGRLMPCMMARWQSYDLRSGSFQQGWSDFLKEVCAQKTPGLSHCQTCSLRSFCSPCPREKLLDQTWDVQPDEYLCHVAQLRAATF